MKLPKICMLVTIVCGSVVSMTDAADRPAERAAAMKIRATLTICSPEECPEAVQAFGRGGPNRLFAVDEGYATHFGKFRTIYAADVGAGNAFVGRFILTAADGSKIFGTNRGFLGVSFEACFQGGTKRLKHARAYARGTIGTEGYAGSGWFKADYRK